MSHEDKGISEKKRREASFNTKTSYDFFKETKLIDGQCSIKTQWNGTEPSVTILFLWQAFPLYRVNFTS